MHIHNSLPMKASFRSLFTVLFALVFVSTLVTSGSILRRALLRFQPQQDPALFESALLKHAAVDATEDQWNREIRDLLDQSQGRLPQTFRSPLFHRYLTDFQKSLRDWSRNKKFQPSVMSELTHLVKRHIDNHKLSLSLSSSSSKNSKKYSSCAVVGNSGILLNTNHGSLIDSHEVVFRLNNARVQGFERKVGSKTNVSFINSNILHGCARMVGCRCHVYNDDVATVTYICQPAHFMDHAVCNGSLDAPLIVTDARLDVLCARIVKYYSMKRFVLETGKGLGEWGPARDEKFFHYSSGFQAVVLALGICDRVGVFGFGKSVKARHHYHTNQKSELHLHDYEAEYDFYRDVVSGRRKNIPFLTEEIELPPVFMYQ